MTKHKTDPQVTGVQNDELLTRNSYPLFVNYGMSVEELVKIGRYELTDQCITSKDFPTKRTGTAEILMEIIHFNRYISTDEVLHELDKMGYRPAELHELLAFGENYPDIQRDFPIIALGSIWQFPFGERYVPFLFIYTSKRCLGLDLVDGDWYEVCRFAAVRK